MTSLADPRMLAIILLGALATYLTRIGGHLLIARMERVPPRLEAALDAVPAAVLTTLVAPSFFYGGLDVKLAMALAFVVALRAPGIPMLLAGWLGVILIRALIA